jgi:predicted transposase/invertase (TIGR01784 family)
MDERESIESAKAEGREEGLKEGRYEEKLTTVRTMLAENINITLIAKITGLSITDIQKLKK